MLHNLFILVEYLNTRFPSAGRIGELQQSEPIFTFDGCELVNYRI